MKIKNTNNRKKKLIIAIIAFALIGGGIAYALSQAGDGQPRSNEELTESIDDTSTVRPEQAQGTDGAPDGSNPDGGPGLPQKPSGGDGGGQLGGTPPQPQPNAPKPEQPRVTRAEQSGAEIRVTALLKQSSNGTCELRLSKAGQATISQRTNIVIGPSYYACGFRIPRGELPAGGQWQAVVLHYQGGGVSRSETKQFQVE